MTAQAPLRDVVSYLDTLLEIAATPDYPQAVNGLQLSNSGQVTSVAGAVDFSSAAVDGAIAAGADLLLVHHGMFWGGLEPITERRFDRLRRLITSGVAVYSAHLPLDRHAQLGNAVLLAGELGLQPSGEFARFKTIFAGVRGEADIPTARLFKRAERFAAQHGGSARISPVEDGHHTRSWAVCTGSGASAETLAEAAELGIDTLITGEGPHWTAVAAAESRAAIIYAGHYATETLGVRALAAHLAQRFALNSTFLELPTGL
ncbi:MAG TPA: Nif3-like dinuclear metal center hexameric protein [Gemmatimonadaceae bacterium]|nr:Nif3-like dinuclear metal center hexameric protein [Gemmatimonadaceae bacterium]